jgi:hypothetical protein
MKRIILVVSLVFMSIFLFSFSEKEIEEEKEVFVDGPFEIGFRWPVNFGLTEFNLPGFAVSSEKRRFDVNEKIDFNIYTSQRLFNNAGTPTEINSFSKTEYQYDSGKYLAFSKIEIRFFLAENYTLSQDKEFLYLTDFIDITYNTSFYIDLKNQPEKDYIGMLAYIDEITYARYVQKTNPIGINFDRPLLVNDHLYLYAEEKLTLSSEFINSPIYGMDNLTFSPALTGVGINNTTTFVVFDKLFSVYFDDEFTYLISPNNLF